jgi:hypothetical protein
MSTHSPEHKVAMRYYDEAINECQRLRTINTELLAMLLRMHKAAYGFNEEEWPQEDEVCALITKAENEK